MTKVKLNTKGKGWGGGCELMGSGGKRSFSKFPEGTTAPPSLHPQAQASVQPKLLAEGAQMGTEMQGRIQQKHGTGLWKTIWCCGWPMDLKNVCSRKVNTVSLNTGDRPHTLNTAGIPKLGTGASRSNAAHSQGAAGYF